MTVAEVPTKTLRYGGSAAGQVRAPSVHENRAERVLFILSFEEDARRLRAYIMHRFTSSHNMKDRCCACCQQTIALHDEVRLYGCFKHAICSRCDALFLPTCPVCESGESVVEFSTVTLRNVFNHSIDRIRTMYFDVNDIVRVFDETVTILHDEVSQSLYSIPSESLACLRNVHHIVHSSHFCWSDLWYIQFVMMQLSKESVHPRVNDFYDRVTTLQGTITRRLNEELYIEEIAQPLPMFFDD